MMNRSSMATSNEALIRPSTTTNTSHVRVPIRSNYAVIQTSFTLVSVEAAILEYWEWEQA